MLRYHLEGFVSLLPDRQLGKQQPVPGGWPLIDEGALDFEPAKCHAWLAVGLGQGIMPAGGWTRAEQTARRLAGWFHPLADRFRFHTLQARDETSIVPSLRNNLGGVSE